MQLELATPLVARWLYSRLSWRLTQRLTQLVLTDAPPSHTLSLAAASVAGAMSVAPVFAADLDAGAQVFAGNCAACHAGGNNVIQNEKTLRKEALEQYLEGGYKESSIIYQVTNGKNAMPAFGGRLDEDEIKNVAAYVFDQSTK